MADVKITVLKRLNNKELFGSNQPLEFIAAPQCDRLKKGQVFISEEGKFPDGFCAWAFADIQRDITTLRFGGSFPWIKEQGAVLSCCTDGARPVIFKLERIEN